MEEGEATCLFVILRISLDGDNADKCLLSWARYPFPSQLIFTFSVKYGIIEILTSRLLRLRQVALASPKPQFLSPNNEDATNGSYVWCRRDQKGRYKAVSLTVVHGRCCALTKCVYTRMLEIRTGNKPYAGVWQGLSRDGTTCQKIKHWEYNCVTGDKDEEKW